MISVFRSSPPGAPRSRITARSMARPAYMPAVMPAGPAPMITTSYSCVLAIRSSWISFRTNAQRSGGVPYMKDVERPMTVRDGSHQHIHRVVRRCARDEGVAFEHRLRAEHADTVRAVLTMKN